MPGDAAAEQSPLPPFETLHRVRPVSLVAPAGLDPTGVLDVTGPGLADPRLAGSGLELPAAAPSVAVEVELPGAELPGAELPGAELPGAAGRVEPALLLGGWRLAGWLEQRRGRTGLVLTPPDGRPVRLRSRRHGRTRRRPDRVGLALTGPWLSLLTREDGDWVVRARADLREHAGAPDVHDEAVLAGLRVGLVHHGRVARLRAGGFGQLGLRDVRVVTDADGETLWEGRRLWLTATHAGPAFADAAHAGVWLLDPEAGALEHTADLFVRRTSPRRRGLPPGVHGDHAVHLVRDGGTWLLAATTWDELGPDPRRRPPPPGAVGHVLARTTADPRRGRHVLDAAPLPLPVTPGAVGCWDAHLRRAPEGGWLVGFVEATRWFRFHPAVAAGAGLDALTRCAADASRTATEGVTLARLDGPGSPVRVLASDGPDSPEPLRRRFSVLDLDLRPVGRLDAPYPSNIPWPTLAAEGDRWWLVTFDGTPGGGRLPGYGTHGDLWVARSAPRGRADGRGPEHRG